jgi:hypothetical protein
MRVLHFALVLLAIFALSISFAIPTEDVPETPYDESEALPYEMTPPFSGDLVQASAPSLQVVPIVPRDLLSTRRHPSGRAECKEPAAHHISNSLIILDHTLRC